MVATAGRLVVQDGNLQCRKTPYPVSSLSLFLPSTDTDAAVLLVYYWSVYWSWAGTAGLASDMWPCSSVDRRRV